MVSAFYKPQVSDDTILPLSFQEINNDADGLSEASASEGKTPSTALTPAVPDPEPEQARAADVDEEDDKSGFSATTGDMPADVKTDNEDEASGEDEMYVVESVVRHRKNKKSFEYRVRWEGYGSDDDTWETHDNLAESANLKVEEYWAAVEAAKKKTPEVPTRKRKRVSSSADVLDSNAVPKEKRQAALSPVTKLNWSKSEREPTTSPSSSRKRSPVPGKESSPIDVDQQEDVEMSEPVSENGRVEPLGKSTPSVESTSTGTEASSARHLPSWEGKARVETIEKDDNNKLIVCLEWIDSKEKSKHAAMEVYKKMPTTMLLFYESNLVFKAAKPN